jgi:hypothetical protein
MAFIVDRIAHNVATGHPAAAVVYTHNALLGQLAITQILIAPNDSQINTVYSVPNGASPTTANAIAVQSDYTDGVTPFRWMGFEVLENTGDTIQVLSATASVGCTIFGAFLKSSLIYKKWALSLVATGFNIIYTHDAHRGRGVLSQVELANTTNATVTGIAAYLVPVGQSPSDYNAIANKISIAKYASAQFNQDGPLINTGDTIQVKAWTAGDANKVTARCVGSLRR